MSIDQISTPFAAFTGSPGEVLKKINLFLSDSEAFENKCLVHALIFSNDMTDSDRLKLNEELAQVYRNNNYSVLGGDTSGGSELCIFISKVNF